MHNRSETGLKRRDFIKLLGSMAAFPLPMPFVWPSAALAQTAGGANLAAAGPSGPANEVGQVATLQGSATVARGNPATTVALRINDAIFKNDTLATGANSSLGVTFDDETTFSLSANTRIVVNEFIYQEAGTGNAASFGVAVGTAAFVASLVAKTGDMKISTPSATLGIRGTTGVVDVPQGGAVGADGVNEPKIKLYPDADGHVGRIEVFNPQGGRLGTLSEGASAFAIRSGPGGRLRVEPFQVPPQEAARDRGVLRRLFVSHDIGRRMTIERVRTRGPDRPGRNNSGRPGRERHELNPDHPGGPARPSQPQQPHQQQQPYEPQQPHQGNPGQPGRGPQELNRNPHPGGPPRPPSQPQPRKSNPGGQQKH